MLYETYWPEGTDDHGMFAGNGRDFVDWVATEFDRFEMMQHQLGQTLIQLEGDQARTETYFYAYHRVVQPSGEMHDFFLSGRYLDLLEKRSDCWRVLKRMAVYDWCRTPGLSEGWGHPLLGEMPRAHTYGKTTRNDLAWEHFARTQP